MKKVFYMISLFGMLLLIGCAEEDARPRPTVPVSATSTPTSTMTPTPTDAPTPTPTKMVHVSDMKFPNHSITNVDRDRQQSMTVPVSVKHTASEFGTTDVEKRLYAGEVVLWEPGTSVDLNGDGYPERIQVTYDANQEPYNGAVEAIGDGITRVDYRIGEVSYLYVKPKDYELTGQVFLACLDGTDTKQVYVLIEYYRAQYGDYWYDCFGYSESEGQAWLYKNRYDNLTKQLPEGVEIGSDRATWLMRGENGETERIDFGVVTAEISFRLRKIEDPWWYSNIDGEYKSGLFPIVVFFPEGMVPVEPEYKELTSRTTVYPDTVQTERIYSIRDAKLTIYGKSEDGRRVFALIENMEQWNSKLYGTYSYGWFDVADLETESAS